MFWKGRAIWTQCLKYFNTLVKYFKTIVNLNSKWNKGQLSSYESMNLFHFSKNRFRVFIICPEVIHCADFQLHCNRNCVLFCRCVLIIRESVKNTFFFQRTLFIFQQRFSKYQLETRSILITDNCDNWIIVVIESPTQSLFVA